MEKIKDKLYSMSLKKSLIIVFILFVVITGALSSITIFISVKIQRNILDTRTLSFTVNDDNIGNIYKVGEGYHWSELTPNNQALYYASIIGMIILIFIYILVGGLLAGNFYYKIKLKKPLQMLENGIDNITKGNLDFSINYTCDDELGKLCTALEKMVDELISDKKQIWEILEDRRMINASISHDIGTPITVIKGYLDYLRKNIPVNNIPKEMLIETFDSMYGATQRIERYIDCVRNIQKIDEIKIYKRQENLQQVLSDMENDLKKLSENYGKKLIIDNLSDKKIVFVDKIQLFRVIENIVTNALRYAQNLVSIKITDNDKFLEIIVEDDGKGFSGEDIIRATDLFYTTSKSKNHMGIGLYISKVLCEKQGGKLYIGNSKIGAKIIIQIKSEC